MNKYNGWLDEQIIDDFVAYAEVVFKRWGQQVQKW